MIIQILNTINDDIKQIRTDVFMKEQGFENEFDEIDENAKIPKYRTVTSPIGELTLAMLMDKKYDDPLWEDLLNQMWLFPIDIEYFIYLLYN